MYACIGVAALAKGPIGMILPLAALGLFLVTVDGPRNFLRSIWWLRPLTAVVVVAAVALPWYVWVGVRTDGEWLRKFWIEFNLRPFKQPILTHGDTGSLTRVLAVLVSIVYFFYHVPAILVGFFPWSVLLGPTLVDTTQRLKLKKGINPSFRDGCLLAVCWFGVWFMFWSVCKTKLPHYLLPAYPALALLVACFVDRWQTQPATVRPWWLRNAWLSLILVGIALMIAMPLLASIFLPGEYVLGLLGLIPVVGGAWCWSNASRQQHRSAAIALAVTAVVFLTAIFGWAVARVDRYQNTRPAIVAIRADSGNAVRPAIATYRFFRESIVCYAGYPITRCNDDENPGQSAQQMLRAFLAKPKPAYVITLTEHLAEIERECPDRFEEIFRQRLLGEPERGNRVVVLRVK
jgi:4-amino-4-deoxy-L-arabinose transferase-like glycosyltransferase